MSARTNPAPVATWQAGAGGPDGRETTPRTGGLARCTEAACDGFRVGRSDGSAGA